MIESICVPPQIHQPQRNLPRRSFQETHSRASIQRLWTSFATKFCDTNLSPTNQRGGTTCSTIWQGNPISAVKTFATKNCGALCGKERLAILKQSRSNQHLLVKQNLRCVQTQTMFPQVCEADHPHHWWVNQWQKSQPNTQSHHRFYHVQCLPSWCPTRSTVRTNKTKLFSFCFQSTSLRNNSNDLFQIIHSLLFSVIFSQSRKRWVHPPPEEAQNKAGFHRIHKFVWKRRKERSVRSQPKWQSGLFVFSGTNIHSNGGPISDLQMDSVEFKTLGSFGDFNGRWFVANSWKKQSF